MGSEMCIRDRSKLKQVRPRGPPLTPSSRVECSGPLNGDFDGLDNHHTQYHGGEMAIALASLYVDAKPSLSFNLLTLALAPI